MEAQFERVTSYKLVGLGACTQWIRAGTYYHWVIAQQGQLGRCPCLAGIPPPQGPMTPPPYPPVTAAASTQATVPNPPQGGGGQPQAESQPRKRDATAAGVQGTARDTGGARDSSARSGRAASREPRTTRSSSRKRRLRDLHEERDSLRNEIELLAHAQDNEQRRETKKTLKRRLDTRRRELHSNQERISQLEELLGLEQSREPPTGQGSLDVIVEETTQTTADEAESGATPPGGQTQDATAPKRETEQDMETEGPGSPVTPNEDDLLTGAGAADVETGIASLHVDSPDKPGGNGDATT